MTALLGELAGRKGSGKIRHRINRESQGVKID